MTGRPSLRVKLDDGTGTFPYDITTYVHLPSAWTNQRGRGSEFDSIDASTLTITLNNNDGRFTLNSSTYGIFVDQMIQVSEALDGVTWVPRFTGYVQNWPTSWTSGPATLSLSTVTAVDRLARLERRTLRSMLEQEILLRNPVFYYTLGEPEGSTSAGDTSGSAAPHLAMIGSGDAVAFGAGTGPGTDGLTAAVFAGGQSLRAAPFTGSPLSLVAFFRHDAALAVTAEQFAFAGDYLRLSMDVSGTISGARGLSTITSPNTYNDGETHCAILTYSTAASPKVQLFIDGALVASHSVASSSNTVGEISVGDDPFATQLPWSGTVSHVAAFPTVLDATAAAAIWSAGRDGFLGESSDARVERLATYAGIDPADMSLETGALTATAAQATTGASLMSALQDVAQSEGGALFIDGAGDLVFQNRTHRVTTATGTAALALATGDAGVDLTWSADKNYMANYVTGTRPNGGEQVAINQDSIDLHEQYPASRSLLVTTDTEVRGAINWQANVYGEVQPRITQVTIDLLTQPSTTIRTAALNLELGDRITISGMPTQAPVSTADLIVEGWTETYGKDVWTLELNTVSATNFHAFIADHTTYGVADAGNRAIF